MSLFVRPPMRTAPGPEGGISSGVERLSDATMDSPARGSMNPKLEETSVHTSMADATASNTAAPAVRTHRHRRE
jgi:hypothetical protein